MPFRIYYGDGHVVEGRTRADWEDAPDDGVQVVVGFPRTQPVRWSYSGGAVRDRDLWTGDDTYDPWDWGVKYGQLIDDETYFQIWERACGSGYP